MTAENSKKTLQEIIEEKGYILEEEISLDEGSWQQAWVVRRTKKGVLKLPSEKSITATTPAKDARIHGVVGHFEHFYTLLGDLQDITNEHLVRIIESGRIPLPADFEKREPHWEENELPYYIEEHAGTSLADHMRNHPDMSFGDLNNILEQIIAGVAALHGKGYVHQDLRAENIFINTANVVKVGDYSQVQQVYPGKLQHQLFRGSRKIQTPEQWNARVSLNSDVWALAVLMQSCYAQIAKTKCAEHPFINWPWKGTKEDEIILEQRVRHNPPNIYGLPRNIQKLLRRCYTKDHTKRYKDAGVLLKDFKKIIHPWKWRARLGLQTGAFLGLLLFGEIIYLFNTAKYDFLYPLGKQISNPYANIHLTIKNRVVTGKAVNMDYANLKAAIYSHIIRDIWYIQPDNNGKFKFAEIKEHGTFSTWVRRGSVDRIAAVLVKEDGDLPSEVRSDKGITELGEYALITRVDPSSLIHHDTPGPNIEIHLEQGMLRGKMSKEYSISGTVQRLHPEEYTAVLYVYTGDGVWQVQPNIGIEKYHAIDKEGNFSSQLVVSPSSFHRVGAVLVQSGGDVPDTVFKDDGILDLGLFNAIVRLPMDGYH